MKTILFAVVFLMLSSTAQASYSERYDSGNNDVVYIPNDSNVTTIVGDGYYEYIHHDSSDYDY